jgi:hypothetical protein
MPTTPSSSVTSAKLPASLKNLLDEIRMRCGAEPQLEKTGRKSWIIRIESDNAVAYIGTRRTRLRDFPLTVHTLVVGGNEVFLPKVHNKFRLIQVGSAFQSCDGKPVPIPMGTRYTNTQLPRPMQLILAKIVMATGRKATTPIGSDRPNEWLIGVEYRQGDRYFIARICFVKCPPSGWLPIITQWIEDGMDITQKRRIRSFGIFKQLRRDVARVDAASSEDQRG